MLSVHMSPFSFTGTLIMTGLQPIQLFAFLQSLGLALEKFFRSDCNLSQTYLNLSQLANLSQKQHAVRKSVRNDFKRLHSLTLEAFPSFLIMKNGQIKKAP